jgi:DNA-binding SARP family transcriptional activator
MFLTGCLLTQLIQQLRMNNQQAQALHYAQRWVARDPLYEPAQQALLELYIETGQQGTAVSHYQQFAHEVKAAYGLQPTVSWTALEAITAVCEDVHAPVGSPAL